MDSFRSPVTNQLTIATDLSTNQLLRQLLLCYCY